MFSNFKPKRNKVVKDYSRVRSWRFLPNWILTTTGIHCKACKHIGRAYASQSQVGETFCSWWASSPEQPKHTASVQLLTWQWEQVRWALSELPGPDWPACPSAVLCTPGTVLPTFCAHLPSAPVLMRPWCTPACAPAPSCAYPQAPNPLCTCSRAYLPPAPVDAETASSLRRREELVLMISCRTPRKGRARAKRSVEIMIGRRWEKRPNWWKDDSWGMWGIFFLILWSWFT